MPNGRQPLFPPLQPKPWEQTWLGRLFQPRISEEAYGGLMGQVTPYAYKQLREADMPSRITPPQWAEMQGQQPPMPAPTPPPKEEPLGQVPKSSKIITDPSGAVIRRFFDAKGNPIFALDDVLSRAELPAEPTPVPTELSPWQKEQIRLAEQEAQITPYQQAQMEWQQQQAMQEQAWQGQQAAQAGQQWQQQFAQAQTQAQRQYEMQQQQWGEQMQWNMQQAQMQQQEAERREMARLSAQPMSWLQYASYTGEEPVVQPWMQPLMQGQYQTGQPISGWTPESGAGMQALTTPSAQLWGRMGPTAQQQYAGYKQSRTGIRPEETLFRMGAGAPPGGRSPGLQWAR